MQEVDRLAGEADARRAALTSNLSELRRRASAGYVIGQTVKQALPIAAVAAHVVAPAVSRVALRNPGAAALAAVGATVAAVVDRDDAADLARRARDYAGNVADRTEDVLQAGISSALAAGSSVFARARAAMTRQNGDHRVEDLPKRSVASGVYPPSPFVADAQFASEPDTKPEIGIGANVLASFVFALTVGLALARR